MPSVNMLNDSFKPYMLSVVMLSVVAPFKSYISFQIGQPLSLEIIKEHLARKELVYQATILTKSFFSHL
jgi:hypothetical protein